MKDSLPRDRSHNEMLQSSWSWKDWLSLSVLQETDSEEKRETQAASSALASFR